MHIKPVQPCCDAQEGFRDLGADVTFPDVARVGSEDAAMANAVRDVWSEGRVNWYLHISHSEFVTEFNRADALLKQVIWVTQDTISCATHAQVMHMS